jgi:hypothetical protein
MQWSFSLTIPRSPFGIVCNLLRNIFQGDDACLIHFVASQPRLFSRRWQQCNPHTPRSAGVTI